MKRLFMIIMCIAAMMAAGTSLKAQEVTIVLNPGWTWISYPSTDTVDIATAFGSFTPAIGDIFKSKWGMATYIGNGQWRGAISPVFYPGYGYHYKSNQTMPVMLTFSVQQPAPQVVVTTSEPMDISATSVVLGSTVTIDEGNHIYVRGVCYDTVQMPTVDNNHTTDSTSIGVFYTTLTGLTPSTTYYIRAYVVTDYGLAYGEEMSFITLNGGGSSGGHDYVDLGLPSGTLWATCNVGANSPEEYGDYFAWGETQPKDIYNWSTYQYCNNGYLLWLTKYCNNSQYGYNGYSDNLTTLLTEDDAATANWGGIWRMPTDEEWQELYQNTTNTWTTQNGVSGKLFTATNGNTLFLPSAGDLCGSEHSGAGYNGNYWSSSLNLENPASAGGVYFRSDNYAVSYRARCSELSVRPVRSSQN